MEWTGSARLVYRETNASVHKYQRTLSYLLHIGCPCPHLMGEVVHIKCDNMMAIACIKNMGSANHLWDKLTGRVFELSFTYQFSLQISYVKSAENVSDSVSQKFTSIHAEWSLSEVDFKKAMALTVFNPNLDLFAHMQNKKFEKFLSWKPCMGATHVDMFTLDWKHLNAFLFLPFFCISSVVKKCLDDQIKHLCGVFPL